MESDIGTLSASSISAAVRQIYRNLNIMLKNKLFANAANAGLPEVLPTKEAATAINRAPQTLRKWAALETGPIRPIRINGRLAWRVSDLLTLLENGEKGVGRG